MKYLILDLRELILLSSAVYGPTNNLNIISMSHDTSGYLKCATKINPFFQVIKGGIAIFSYQAHLGTLFHDVAHILGGVREGKRTVPCLYDYYRLQAGHFTQTRKLIVLR